MTRETYHVDLPGLKSSADLDSDAFQVSGEVDPSSTFLTQKLVDVSSETSVSSNERSEYMPESNQNEPTAVAWPYWMQRYIATDDEQAFWDLVWSVGGSPPYGGVSYEEAQAVYDLIEGYRGPGMASPDLYQGLAAFVAGDSVREQTVEVFRVNDSITSQPESFGADVVAQGRKLAEELEHDGLRCVFMAYDAQVTLAQGDSAGARDITIEALKLGLPLAAEDAAYSRRMAQLAQNAVSLTAIAGDREGALKLQEQLRDILDPNILGGDDSA